MKKTGKKWLGLQFDSDEEKGTNGAPLDRKPLKKSKIPDFCAPKKRTFNFHKRLTPQSVADLAVHSKKVAEVEVWLQNNVLAKAGNNQTAKFLLVSGPTGSGKTITVQVLCQSLDIDVSEWVNPLDQDFEVFHGPNQVTRFVEFLTESKWNSLFASNGLKVILVEEFPNALVRRPEDFTTVLEECYYKGNYPIIFVCTDTLDNKMNLSEKLFTDDVISKYQITQISFNACAPTQLKNALRRAHNLVTENPDLFKTPTHNTVNAILATSMGDIKCALNQYYFASLLGTSELPTVTEKSKPGTKRKRNDRSSSVQTMSRDETLGIFHGIGRVLNPKRTEQGRFSCNLDKLIDEFATQPGTFTGFLFENYLKYFSDLNDAKEAADCLSLAQTFLEKWVDRDSVLTFALWVSVMGLMVHNGHKVSKWNQITGPKRVNRKVMERNVHVTDLYYHNVINKVECSRFLYQ